MSLAILSCRGAARVEAPPSGLDSLPIAVLTGWALVALMTLGKAVAVWRTGVFFGPDDAMRAVEVRDFMSGQGWFDLVPRRLSPDHPFTMHWSRLADLPLAGLEWGFGQVTDAATAERLTRLVEPAALYALILVCLTRLARTLCGARGPLAVALLAAGALDAVGDVLPGRIHHHGLQLLLLVAMLKLVCDGLDPTRPARMAGAGALAALSLAINLQNMPFVAAVAGMLAIVWALRDAPAAVPLAHFGAGLAGGAIVVFLLQVPPSRYGDGACDAFGTPHVLGAVTAGLCFATLAWLRGPPSRRVIAVALAGASWVGVIAATFPACLGDPYAGVDPFIRAGWMAEVGEAMPLHHLLERDPRGTLPILVAILLGLGTLGAAFAADRGEHRWRWAILFGVDAVAVLGSFWQIRVAASAELLGTLGGAWLLCRLFAHPPAGRRYVALRAVLLGAALTAAGWAAALNLLPAPTAAPPRSALALDPVDPPRCDEPASYEAMAALAPGLVLSTIDPGAHILGYTAHRAIAAPYHRNAYGLRLALTVFAAAADEARPLVAESRADYLALCTASPEVHDILRHNPQGFAARLLGGPVPDWITPLAGSGPFRLYAVTTPR